MTAGTGLQEVFDLPLSNPSSGSLPIIPNFPSPLLPTLASRSPNPSKILTLTEADMSGKYFMPSLGASHSHVEDVVASYLGRNARVSECSHQVNLTNSWMLPDRD